MSKKVLSQTITKKQALEGIGTILKNFNNLIIELNWDLPKTNYTELKKFADYMTDEGYLEAFRTIPYQTVLDNVDTEGYLELITKCGKLSKLYGLDVEVPENVEVLGEGVVEDFITDLTQYSLNALNKNKTELTKTYNELLSQTNELNLKDSKQTPLEEIILKSREYKIAKTNADNASTELMNMAASAGSGASYDEKEYARYQQIYNSNTAEMDYIKRNYPLVTFFNGKEDKKTVEKQLGKAYKEINKALDNLIARIHDGKYPIWHFDSLVEQLLEKYEDKDKSVIQAELTRMKKKEELTDLLLTIGPMVLSVAILLIPGGASFVLLGLRAGVQVANAAVGVMSAVNDIHDATIMKDESYASLKISPEVQQLMNKENCDINDAKFQYIVALVSSGFVVFDVMDAVDAFKLIKKCGQLDDVTRNALKQSKRFGEKAFKELSVERLNTLDDYFLLFYNNDSSNIVKMYHKLPQDVVCKSPDELLTKYTKTFKKFDDFAADVGKNFIGSVEDKVRIIQSSFENLSSDDRKLLTIPDNAVYVKGFGPTGRVEYLWPENLGIKIGSDAAVISAKGNVDLPDELYRVGSYWGNNFSDAVYSYDELAVPYKYNDEALTVFKIRKDSYIKKIDAIASGDIDELNKILKSEGIAEINKIDFKDIKESYFDFQNAIKKEKRITCNPKYGIKGTVAEWYNPNDKTVKWFNGGAPQFITPLNVFDMKTLGIIKEL